MGATYTADELKRSLRMDAAHGDKYAFALNKMDSLGHTFTVENLLVSRFSGGSKGVVVSTGADTLIQAIEWAKDGMREWAAVGTEANGNYFGNTARSWADSQRASTAKACGSTLDFLFLFSGTSGPSISIKMYPALSTVVKDSCNLLTWVFANMWSVVNPAGLLHMGAAVNIEGPKGGGPPGLHKDYWDSVNGTNTDQSHHFAFYFAVGARFGSNLEALKPFLIATKDWSPGNPSTITNAGDYYLGLTAARLGSRYRASPGFHGNAIAQALLSESPDIPIRPDPTPPTPPTPPVPPGPFVPRTGAAKTTGTVVRVRTGPGLSYPTVRLLADRGTRIHVLTQVHGDNVDGNPLWNQISDGYISDRYVSFDK